MPIELFLDIPLRHSYSVNNNKPRFNGAYKKTN